MTELTCEICNNSFLEDAEIVEAAKTFRPIQYKVKYCHQCRQKRIEKALGIIPDVINQLSKSKSK